MNDYFTEVVSSLSMEDMRVLGILHDQEANQTFKAIRCSEVQLISSFSDATFRKVIQRLSAKKLIEIVSLSKQHSLYITQYGIEALKINLEGIA